MGIHMHRTIILPALVLVSLLGACVERGDLVGAGVGAGAGCLVGEAIRNGRCVEGAAVGAVTGVAANRVVR